MTFSKKDSLAIKGIAILMMLMHHNFMSIPYFQKYSVSFAPFSQTSVVQLAIFCKICVGIFVFISGYGLTLSLKKINSNYKLYIYEIDKYIINRLISLLSGYWFIVISSNIICQLINGRTYTIYFSEGIKRGIISLVINFFGLSELCGLDQLNGTWWYMSFVVLIVFLVPIAIILYKKIGIFISLFLCILIPRVLKITNNNMTNWVLAVIRYYIC